MSFRRFYCQIFVWFLILNPSLSSQNSVPKYWVWLQDNERVDLDSVFVKLNDTGIQGLLVAPSAHSINEITTKARKYGIDVHLWRWILNTQNKKIIKDHPEWGSINRKGQNTFLNIAYVNYYRFMCPALPEVRSFVLSEIQHFLEFEGLSGISMDYCRYVDVILPEQLWEMYGIKQDKEYPEWDYGYHPYIIQLFKERFGYNPLELEDPTLDLDWKVFREKQVNDLAKMISKKVREKNKIISASPFPTPSLARKHVRQDWASWELDYVFPMIYNGFYKEEGPDWFKSCLHECLVTMRPKGTKVFPGIYADGHRDRDFSITQAMEISLSFGADGFAFFSYNDLSDKEWEEIKSFIQNNSH